MKKTKVLIVDDYRENIEALSQLIKDERVETYFAMNASDALELISQHEFGLALLDVQMPGTSGFELAQLIRSVKRFKSLPIIFVTAQPQDSSLIFQGYQTGAIDVLFKPLDPNMVRAKVQMFVELAQQKALLESHVEELERLRHEADAANLAKSQFLANMSHEIRTPLAAVMGFAEMISKGGVTDKDKEEFSEAIKRNGNLLMRLIDDLLDLSKIEANRFELENVSFSLPTLLRDVESTMSFKAQEKGVAVNFNFPPQLHSTYRSDPVKLKQILLNIIGNAVKFSPGGVVKVDVDVKSEARNKADVKQRDRLVITISDNGVGLNKQQAERLFQPFGQADPSTKRKFGGSGLGLIISRQIARAMDGDLTLVSSQPGEGSTFQIEVVIEQAKDADLFPVKSDGKTLEEDQAISIQGRRILAVDDSQDNLMLISHFLKGLGLDIVYAENGYEAVEATKKDSFDLILMDVQMPGMDGHETTAEIRGLGFKKPIIALTAHALKYEHDKCRASGCNDVLTKPISRTSLIGALETYLSSQNI